MLFATKDFSLYFTQPEQLLDIFTQMEEKSLPLVEKSQQTSEYLDNIHSKILATQAEQDHDVDQLELAIHHLEELIQRETEREDACRALLVYPSRSDSFPLSKISLFQSVSDRQGRPTDRAAESRRANALQQVPLLRRHRHGHHAYVASDREQNANSAEYDRPDGFCRRTRRGESTETDVIPLLIIPSDSLVRWSFEPWNGKRNSDKNSRSINRSSGRLCNVPLPRRS